MSEDVNKRKMEWEIEKKRAPKNYGVEQLEKDDSVEVMRLKLKINFLLIRNPIK